MSSVGYSETIYLEMKEKHPKWIKGVLQQLAWTLDGWERIRLEVLNEGRCQTCGREYGEHGFDEVQKFICPKGEK